MKFISTTNIVMIQDELCEKINNNIEFSEDEYIDLLTNNFYIDCSFGGLNSVSNNNIAVRNHLLLSLLYFLKSDNYRSDLYRDTAIYLLKYNIIDDSIWQEGPGYYLYTYSVISTYLNIIPNKEIEEIHNCCWRSIIDYITPDNKLPPISDTRRNSYEFLNYNNENNILKNSEQTLFKYNNLYVFFRHPQYINKYKLSGHTHWDIGNLCVYKNKECILLPVGYPGYDKKQEEGLDNIIYQNSIYLENLGNWKIKSIKCIDIQRYQKWVKITYKIGEYTKFTREIVVGNNSLKIRDDGTDGINLNLADNGYTIKVKIGKEPLWSEGKHCENLDDVLSNKRVFIGACDKITEIILNF